MVTTLLEMWGTMLSNGEECKATSHESTGGLYIEIPHPPILDMVKFFAQGLQCDVALESEACLAPAFWYLAMHPPKTAQKPDEFWDAVFANVRCRVSGQLPAGNTTENLIHFLKRFPPLSPVASCMRSGSSQVQFATTLPDHKFQLSYLESLKGDLGNLQTRDTQVQSLLSLMKNGLELQVQCHGLGMLTVRYDGSGASVASAALEEASKDPKKIEEAYQKLLNETIRAPSL